jgi:hypothetical protein
MAKDYTKYCVEGLGENLNKRQLVYTVVKDWANKNNPSFDAIQKAFPDEVQGSKGFICKESEVQAPQKFNMREPLKIKNGALVVVSNQWGDNIKRFLSTATKLGYKIENQSTENSDEINNSQEEFKFNHDLDIESIKSHIDNLVRSSTAVQASFSTSLIQFVNENNECYWLIPAIDAYVGEWEGRSDDDELNLSIGDLYSSNNGRMESGKNYLDFNPKKKYKLFYHEYEELFSADEDYNDLKSFFETIINLFFDLKDNSTQGRTDLIDDKFYHLCCTVLYCTISESCINDIRVDALTELLLLINFEDLPELNDSIMGGDYSSHILECVIESFQFDRADFCDEENLWRGTYLMNYEELAQTLLDNDVFDHDWYEKQ